MRRNLIAVALLIFLSAGGFFGYRYYQQKKVVNAALSRRQAVFLNNGQVYFGFVDGPDKQIVHINDVYYLKNQQNANENQQQSTDTKNGSQFILVKLGNESYGVESSLYVNRDQIVYYEDLRDDSKVSQAIKNNNSSVNLSN